MEAKENSKEYLSRPLILRKQTGILQHHTGGVYTNMKLPDLIAEKLHGRTEKSFQIYTRVSIRSLNRTGFTCT